MDSKVINKKQGNENILPYQKEWGIPDNHGQVVYFNIILHDSKGEVRSVKSSLSLGVLNDEKLNDLKSSSQQFLPQKFSMYRWMLEELESDQRDFNLFMRVMFNYLCCQGSIIEFLKKSNGSPIGCLLTMDSLDNSVFGMGFSDVDTWLDINTQFDNEFQFKSRNVV